MRLSVVTTECGKEALNGYVVPSHSSEILSSKMKEIMIRY